jgi:hypothetical protein
MRSFGRFFCFALLTIAVAADAAFAQTGALANIQTADEQLLALANQARERTGAGRLMWDPALAKAALEHCRRMAKEGPIAHRYNGELDLAGRAGAASAHFDLIEENVAVGPSAAAIHDEWMNSQGHRENLLNPAVNHVGFAVVESRGLLYAVADYGHAVGLLGATEAEARVAALIKARGVAVGRDPLLARRACLTDSGMPRAAGGASPGFVMRWQDADLSRLPKPLMDRLASGRYQRAEVGNCPAQGMKGTFTTFRIAVLLY